MDSDPEVMATLGGVRSEAGTDRWMAAQLEHWAALGFGIWIALDRDARASVAAARVVGLDEVYALTLVTNTASENVMQKLGMTYVATFDWVDQPYVLYHLTLEPHEADSLLEGGGGGGSAGEGRRG